MENLGAKFSLSAATLKKAFRKQRLSGAQIEELVSISQWPLFEGTCNILKIPCNKTNIKKISGIVRHYVKNDATKDFFIRSDNACFDNVCDENFEDVHFKPESKISSIESKLVMKNENYIENSNKNDIESEMIDGEFKLNDIEINKRKFENVYEIDNESEMINTGNTKRKFENVYETDNESEIGDIDFEMDKNELKLNYENEENRIKKIHIENEYAYDSESDEIDGKEFNINIDSSDVIAESTTVQDLNVTKSFECSLNEMNFPEIPNLPTHNVNLVPLVKISPKRSFKNINVFSMTFRIDSFFLIRCRDPRELKYIVRRYFRVHNNVCVLYYKLVRYAKQGIVNIFGYCAHYSCVVFKIRVNLETGDTIIHQNEPQLKHSKGIKLTAQVRGVERKIIGQKLKNKTAANYRSTTINSLPEKIYNAGNLADTKNILVLRKIRAQAKALRDRNVDDVFDLIEMQRENSNYIQKVGSPFFVHIYSKEQIDLLKRMTPENNTMYFDATGKISKEQIKKRILYYTGVVRLDNKTLPIVEMFSSGHKASDIASLLVPFRQFCELNNVWPPTKRVITDCSAAIIKAFILHWIIMPTRLVYENECFKCVTNNKIPSFIVIQYCSFHYTKLIDKDLEKIIDDDCVRKNFSQIICMAKSFTTLEMCLFWFSNLIILLKNKFQSFYVCESEKNMILCANNDESKIKNCNLDLMKDVSVHESFSYDGSSENNFTLLFNQFYKSKIGYINDNYKRDEGRVPNKYYNEEVMNLILNKYIPDLPYWTNIMGLYIDPSTSPTNNVIESKFGRDKNSVFEQNLHQKPSRAIRTMRSDTLSLCKEIRLKLPKTRICSQKLALKNLIPEEEEWCKKPKRRNYFNPLNNTNASTLKFDNNENLNKLVSPVVIDSLKINKNTIEENKIVEHLQNEELKFCKIETESSIDKTENSIDKTEKNVTKTNDGINLVKFKNNVIINYEYYDYWDEVNIIDKFSIATYNMKKINFHLRTIFLEDIRGLITQKNGTAKWLTGTLIDLFFALISYKNSNCMIIRYSRVVNIFDKNGLVTDIKKKIISQSIKQVFMPKLESNNHWVLVFADFENKTFTYLDSMKNRNEYSLGLEMFEIFIVKFIDKVEKNNWTYKMIEHDFQNDMENCGVFIAQFAHRILNNLCLTNLESTNIFRNEMFYIILEQSEDIANYCLYCGVFWKKCMKNDKPMIQCDSCERWICNRCIPNIKEVEEKELICKLCKHYKNLKFGRSCSSNNQNNIMIPAYNQKQTEKEVVNELNQIKFYENKLIKNDNYYVDVQKQIHVCFYPGMFEFWDKLTNEELCDLDRNNGDTKICNFMIDIFFFLLAKIYKCGTLRTDEVLEMIENSDTSAIKKSNLFEINNIILIPFLLGKTDFHWCLMIVDVKKKTMFWVDSIMNNKRLEISNGKFYFTKLLNYYINYTYHREWNLQTISHSVQHDDHNCGIYVMKFGELFLKSKPLTEHFDCLNYRKYLKKFFIEHSKETEYLCLYCGTLGDKNIQCIICNRWICSNYVCQTEIVEEINFVCILCTNYCKSVDINLEKCKPLKKNENENIKLQSQKPNSLANDGKPLKKIVNNKKVVQSMFKPLFSEVVESTIEQSIGLKKNEVDIIDELNCTDLTNAEIEKSFQVIKPKLNSVIKNDFKNNKKIFEDPFFIHAYLTIGQLEFMYSCLQNEYLSENDSGANHCKLFTEYLLPTWGVFLFNYKHNIK